MHVRLAMDKDFDQLIKMRWDFTNEYNENQVADEHYAAFAEECRTFLEQALDSGKWFVWVADLDGQVCSHVYLELIDKVPRPGRKTNPFVYMTNVYTLPEFRGKGIGSQLLKEIEAWSRREDHEFLIVWPSNWSIEFYERNGYQLCKEPMELML